MKNILETEGTKHPLSKFVTYGPKGPMRSPARALGWFSIGLGLAELLAPRALSRAAGMPERPGMVRVFGLREIGTGVGLLVSRDPTPWLWARVAGDALDILTVASGPVSGGRRPVRTLTALTMLGGIAALDAAVAKQASPERRREPVRDYSDRSGFPRSPAAMRGTAARQAAAAAPANGQDTGRAIGQDTGQAGDRLQGSVDSVLSGNAADSRTPPPL